MCWGGRHSWKSLRIQRCSPSAIQCMFTWEVAPLKYSRIVFWVNIQRLAGFQNSSAAFWGECIWIVKERFLCSWVRPGSEGYPTVAAVEISQFLHCREVSGSQGSCGDQSESPIAEMGGEAKAAGCCGNRRQIPSVPLWLRRIRWAAGTHAQSC